jgi:hypothetical protein
MGKKFVLTVKMHHNLNTGEFYKNNSDITCFKQ